MLTWKLLVERSGLFAWLVVAATATVVAALKPEVRSVLVAYDFGTREFYAHRSLYNLDSAMGYLYAPGFAALYAPFYAVGPAIGGLLWRGMSVGLLTYVVLKQAKRLDSTNATEIASLALFIAIPLSLGAVRNGQATVILTAACWLLTLSALEGKRRSTLVWGLIALLLKPTAIVVVLLMAALRPRLIPYLLVSLLLVFAIPYAFAPVEYVTSQNLEFIRLLTSMSDGHAGKFVPADFTAIVNAVGLGVPSLAAIGVRLLVAGLVLMAVVWLDYNNRPHRTFAIFLLAAFYMTVFNPRVESNTYVMLAVPVAMAISYFNVRKEHIAATTVLGAMVFVSGLTGVNGHLHAALNPWFKPLVMTLAAIPLMLWLFQKSTVPNPTPATA